MNTPILHVSVNGCIRCARRISLVAPAALLFLTLAAPAWSQNAAGKKYFTSRITVSRTEELAFNQMVNSGAVRDDDIFKKMIQKKIVDFTVESNKSKMANLRQRGIKNQVLQRSGQKGGNAHDRANSLLLQYLPKLAVDARRNYHPGARYNWVLLLGQLDAQEPNIRGEGARPLPAALDPLLTILKDAKQIDALHVAALVGILRHAESGLTGGDLDNVATAMTDFLARLEQEAEQTPGKRDVRGQAWLEMRAVNVLGALGVANDEVLDELGKRLADSQRPLWLRCAAARSLGRLDVSGNAQFDTQQSQQLADGFSNLVVTVSQQNVDRRSIRWSLECVKDGLAGGAVTKIDAANIESTQRWAGGIQNLLDLFEDKTLKTDEKILIARLKQGVEDIRSGPAAEPVAPAAAVPDTTDENSAADATQDPPDTGTNPLDDIFDE